MEHHIDAKGKTLGRLASEIAVILQGKRSPNYEPRLASGEKVYVENFKGVSVTTKKREGRVYYRHTGYMGHLKEKTLGEALTKNPKRVLRDSVLHMLPKNRLAIIRIKNLIFVDPVRSRTQTQASATSNGVD